MPAEMKICLLQFIGIISFFVIQKWNKNGWAFKKRFEQDHHSRKHYDNNIERGKRIMRMLEEGKAGVKQVTKKDK